MLRKKKSRHKPVRMCISCRTRALQIDLLRLQCQDKKLTNYKDCGRSFYICKNCLQKKDKKLTKTLSKICKKEVKLINLECLING